jgi:hypothetical protein
MKTTVFLLLSAVLRIASAHELQENRATLVLRERNHVAVTLYISYTEALYQALAPQRPYAAFLLVYSAMKPEELQKQLLRAQARFESATRMYSASGKEIKLGNWAWPDVKQVQAILQQRVIQAMVDPNAHSHEAPLEIHADANASEVLASVKVRFPEEFQKVLVVSFRPNQQWVDGKALSPEIRF